MLSYLFNVNHHVMNAAEELLSKAPRYRRRKVLTAFMSRLPWRPQHRFYEIA